MDRMPTQGSYADPYQYWIAMAEWQRQRADAAESKLRRCEQTARLRAQVGEQMNTSRHLVRRGQTMRNTPEHCSNDTINQLVDYGTMRRAQRHIDETREGFVFWYLAKNLNRAPDLSIGQQDMRHRIMAGVGLSDAEYFEAFGYGKGGSIFEEYDYFYYERNLA